MNNEKLHKRIFYKSHRAHKKDRYKIFSLFSLCFHNNRTTSHTLTNFSTLVALRIRVVINTVVLFLSSHFEKERVGERERESVCRVCREKRGNNTITSFNERGREKSERTPTRCEVGSRHRRLVETNRLRRDWWDHFGDVDVSRDDGEDGSGSVWNRYRRWERVRRCQQAF